MMTRLAALALIALASSANAQTPSLRPTVLVSGDLVRIGDLVADVETEKADIAVFRAPDLGETGSVRVTDSDECSSPYRASIGTSRTTARRMPSSMRSPLSKK